MNFSVIIILQHGLDFLHSVIGYSYAWLSEYNTRLWVLEIYDTSDFKIAYTLVNGHGNGKICIVTRSYPFKLSMCMHWLASIPGEVLVQISCIRLCSEIVNPNLRMDW